MNKLNKGLTLAGLVVVAGCAAVPVPPEYYAGVVKDLAPKKGVMIVSGCAARDEVGQDFIMTETSDAHTQLWQRSAAPYLAGYGLPLSSQPIRMTCAGYKLEPNEKLFFVPNKEAIAQAKPATFPHVISAEPALEPATAVNLNALFADMYAAKATAIMSARQAPPRPKLKMTAAGLQQLRTATGADYAWLISTVENDVSMGKVVGTAVLTAVLSLGTYAAAPTGGRSNTVALIDLVDGTLVWKKVEGNAYGTTSTTATGTTAAPTYQTTSTHAVSSAGTDQVIAAGLFQPLLPIGQGLAGQGVTQPAPLAAPAAPAAPAATK